MTTGDGRSYAQYRSIHILGVDDDPVSRLVLEATLSSRGHLVTMAGDGAAAWQLIESLTRPKSASELSDPLLAILDLFMPGVDGLELCQRIRNRPRTERPKTNGWPCDLSAFAHRSLQYSKE